MAANTYLVVLGFLLNVLCHSVADSPPVYDSATCSGSQYACYNGDCIPYSQRCDGVVNCLDNSDEIDCDDIFAIETDDDFDDLTVKKTSIGLGAFVAVFIVITFIVVIVMKMRQSERGELKLPKNRPKTFSSYLKSPGKYRHLMSVQRDDEDDLAALTSSRSSSTHSNLSQLSGHRGRCADSNGSLSVSRTSSRHSIRSNEPFGLDDHVTAV